MATGPIETHLHRSFNWENGAPGSRMGSRGRSANCGSEPSAQCVRLRSEINQPLLILNVTAKNVSDDLQTVMFSGNEILTFQDGKGLKPDMFVEGLDLPESRQIQPGTELEGWFGFELIDETTPVECKAGCQTAASGDENAIYGLTNPQTIDLSTL